LLKINIVFIIKLFLSSDVDCKFNCLIDQINNEADFSVDQSYDQTVAVFKKFIEENSREIAHERACHSTSGIAYRISQFCENHHIPSMSHLIGEINQLQ
jgi:hypothetical protein